MAADRGLPAADAETSEPFDALAHKLGRLVALSAAEIALLRDLQAAGRRVARHRDIIAEGRTYDGVLILIDGLALRYRVLRDGRRQVLNIVLPGDFIGFPACFFEDALYTIAALTDCLVASVPFARLLGLFEEHPRLAAAIFWSFSHEAAMYAEHLIGVGRRTAIERVAHFLLELLTRCEAAGLADGASYDLPLTQELLGDALGLSLQYVNRTLKRLRADRLISIDGQRVTIEDVDALAALADFEQTYLGRPRVAELRAMGRQSLPA